MSSKNEQLMMPPANAASVDAASADAAPSNKRAAGSRKLDWLVPVGLIALTLVPFVAGSMRLFQLASGAEVTPENARFFAVPAPVIIHIIGGLVFLIVGAFQFPARIRRGKLGWHRAAGRVLMIGGLAAALSGLWMTIFYPRPENVGDLLTAFRLVFGSVMAISIVLSYVAIRQRNVAQHRAWMMRAYAIGIGAGSQVFTALPYYIFFGEPDTNTWALLMAAGWLINLAVAEWIIRRNRASVHREQVSAPRLHPSTR